jgi:hypothetical protein
MRVFLVGLAVSTLLLLPFIAELAGSDMQGLWILSIPFVGLDYIGVFFHELGHFFTRWFFGFPAFPSFDFAFGGGMTYHALERSKIVLGLVYLVFAYTCWLQWKGGETRMLIIVGVCAALHIVASLTRWSEIIPVYMGHGGEIIVSAFCILRATMDWPRDAHGTAEKYLNMTFGIFTLMKNMIRNIELMTSAAKRDAYANAKGGHVQMDLDTISDLLHTKVQYVAAGSSVFLLLCCILVGWLAVRRPWEEA